MRRLLRFSAALALALAVAWLGLCLATGYWGGRVFVDHRPQGRAQQALAIAYFSGDMGTHLGLEPALFARLSARGYPLVAVNTLAFLRTRRSPDEIAGLVRAAVARASALGTGLRSGGAGGKVLLVGQSLGADMLHVGLARLPADLRARVAGVVYIVPGRDVLYHATPGDLLSWFDAADGRALATAARVDWAPVSCIYGIEEAQSLCRELKLPRLRVTALPGGHLLNFAVGRTDRALAEAIAFSLGGVAAGAQREQ